MKKILAAVCSVLLAGALIAGCSGGTGPASSDGGSYRIALVMSHMSNSFTTTLAGAAEQEAAANGMSLTVFDGNQDVATQISQIESAIAQGYDGIIVEPVSQEGITPALKAANNANVPIITVAQQAAAQDMAAAFVGGDDKSAGRLQMEMAIEAMGGTGSVAVLYGPMGSDGQLLRQEGYAEVLAANPDVTLAFEQTANWDTAEAMTVVENWLSTGTEINAVVAQNDSMAIGALKAIDNAGRSDSIKVYGVDATDDGLNSIKSGALDGTVSQDTAGMGATAVTTLKRVLDGETVEPITFTEARWITADNVDELVTK